MGNTICIVASICSPSVWFFVRGVFSERQYKRFCEVGIVRHHTIMETPHEIAEHVCGTLLEKARCMLSNFSLSMDFWAEFVSSCYLVVFWTVGASLDHGVCVQVELEIQALGAFIQLCQDMLGFVGDIEDFQFLHQNHFCFDQASSCLQVQALLGLD